MGDEGGFAPNIASNEEGLNLVNQAIEVCKTASELRLCAYQLYWLYGCCLRKHDSHLAGCATDISWLSGQFIFMKYLGSVTVTL